MKNKLIILSGCPGSGKTTYAKRYLKDIDYISRDEIRFKIVKEDEPYFSKEEAVFNTFVDEINKRLRAGVDVIADATHLNPKSRLKLLSCLDLDKNKTQVEVYFLDTPLDICLARNEQRIGTRSYVPRGQLRRMFFSIVAPNFEECYGLIDVIHTIKTKGGVEE